jgi:activator of 2-hydroxyglutaryl-CoA dehydratase
MMTGGVARNTGVVRELEVKLGERLIVSEKPELCGALGAALSALELSALGSKEI